MNKDKWKKLGYIGIILLYTGALIYGIDWSRWPEIIAGFIAPLVIIVFVFMIIKSIFHLIK